MKCMINGKKIIVLGDRDGIPGPAIEECVKTAGAEVIFAATECFV
jgi:glycine reductase